MLPKFNHCESCGMPMMSAEDHGGGDIKNDWCVHCCEDDGTHKEYGEILTNMSNFMLTKEAEQMSGIKYSSFEEAKADAKKYLSKMPAWKTN